MDEAQRVSERERANQSNPTNELSRAFYGTQSERCQGGESNSRPRAYESPALPLSYPGGIFLDSVSEELGSDQPRKLSGLLYR